MEVDDLAVQAIGLLLGLHAGESLLERARRSVCGLLQQRPADGVRGWPEPSKDSVYLSFHHAPEVRNHRIGLVAGLLLDDREHLACGVSRDGLTRILEGPVDVGAPARPIPDVAANESRHGGWSEIAGGGAGRSALRTGHQQHECEERTGARPPSLWS